MIDEANLLFQRIDRNYMPIDVDGDYWLTNPIWQVWMDSLNIVSGTPKHTDVGGQKMIRIPKIWIKSGKVPSGPFVGKRMWLIDPTTPTSEERADGWHIHNSFAIPGGGYQDYLLISAYLLRNISNVASSVSSGSPYTTGTMGSWGSMIAARNTDNSDPLKRGWYPMPYYCYELFKLLGLIEYGSLA